MRPSDVTMIGTQGPDTGVAVILGEASVPTTAKGYERLLRWAEAPKPCGRSPGMVYEFQVGAITSGLDAHRAQRF